MTEPKKSAKRTAVERLDLMAKDPEGARAKLVEQLKADGLDDAAIDRELAIVQATLGI